MSVSETIVIAAQFVVGAGLYACVGHGATSSYLAVMGLFSFTPEVMKPTALALSILVAAVATIKFYRARLFKWERFWPFAVASIPAAFVGGATQLPSRWYKVLVGIVLLYAAVWMFRSSLKPIGKEPHPPPLWAAIVSGLAIGFLSGLTGGGGGIFFSSVAR